MEPRTYFVVGVNGVGKTTTMYELKNLLPKDIFDIHDFDERGVPDNGGRKWRLEETEYWLKLGEENKRKNLSTVICGFAKPEELGKRATVILLDADEETIEKRLKNRYQTEASLVELKRATDKSLEKFIMDNCYYSSILRKECQEAGCKIIDTKTLEPSEAAHRVWDYMEKSGM